MKALKYCVRIKQFRALVIRNMIFPAKKEGKDNTGNDDANEKKRQNFKLKFSIFSDV